MQPEKPRSRSFRRIVLACAAVCLFTALCSAAGVLTVKNLGALLDPVSPSLGEIFSALRQAEIRPVPWATLCCAAGAVLCGRRLRRGRGLLWLLPTGIFVLMAVFTAILSVRVNGIVFYDVLRPLVKTALSGGLDALM
ncbi:MAG: hypothetical protein IK132_07315 [Clostridia bacterium]|nr:hypothetical protein [Clostridia bacterium]